MFPLRSSHFITGDAFGAGIVAHLSSADLIEMDARDLRERQQEMDELARLEAQNGVVNTRL